MAFSHNNHYVPCLYLKHFAAPSGSIWQYRVLVSHPHIPVWKQVNAGGAAYRADLYTRFAFGTETDEIETWLNREFETPAEDALRKATEDARLTTGDWRNLIRFLAAQFVRTPAFLAKNLPRWNELTPRILNDTMQDLPRKLELAKQSGRKIRSVAVPNSEYIPLRVRREPGGEFVTLRAETVVGLGIWLFTMKNILTTSSSLKALLDHRWSILHAPDNLSWFTSDDPVVNLNYHHSRRYDFEGGWGSKGTEIFLPLSPRHLLYTQIGQRPPDRGSVMPYAQAEGIRRLIAEHAYRYIFSSSEDAEIPKLRPRTVSADAFRNEGEQWRRWHEEQTKAERDLMS
jgi:hypothetical protein